MHAWTASAHLTPFPFAGHWLETDCHSIPLKKGNGVLVCTQEPRRVVRNAIPRLCTCDPQFTVDRGRFQLYVAVPASTQQ